MKNQRDMQTSYARIGALRRLPWYGIETPPDIAHGIGMIHDDERRMLFTLAKDYYSGEGRIIDAGTFLGSSSLALGHGLKARGYPQEKIIDAFDHFKIDAGSVALNLDSRDPLTANMKEGDDMLPIYSRNVAEVAEYISIHQGDLLAKPWSGEKIEILFCDISKNLDVNDYIVTQWLTHLVPETGILIQQDQIQEHHVWVAITMSILSDYFEVIDYTLNSSMVYRLKRPIRPDVIEKCLYRNIPPADMEFHYLNSLELFRRGGMGRYTGWRLGMVELGLAVLYGFHIGDSDKARYTIRTIKEKFGDIADTMTRVSQIEAHLDAGTPCPGSRLFWT